RLSSRSWLPWLGLLHPESAHEAVFQDHRVALWARLARRLIDANADKVWAVLAQRTLDELLEMLLGFGPFGAQDARAASDRDEVGPLGRRRLLHPGNLVGGVVPDDDGEIPRSHLGHGRQAIE